MGSKFFMSAIVVLGLLLTAALSYAIIDNKPDQQVTDDGLIVGDVLSSLPPTLQVTTTGDLTFVTSSKGMGTRLNMTIFRAMPASGWYCVGDLAEPGYGRASHQILLVRAINDDPANPLLASPADWVQVWNDFGSGASDDTSFWRPVPPPGYVALGCVGVNGYKKPSLPGYMCVRSDLVMPAIENSIIWNDHNSHARMDVMLWSIDPAAGQDGIDGSLFWAHGDYSMTPGDNVYCLNKTRVQVL